MMRQIVLFALLAFSSLSFAANVPLISRMTLVERNLDSQDPSTDGTGPKVDVWHLSLENPNSAYVASLELRLQGEWINNAIPSIAFREAPELPVVGPGIVAESFFVAPSNYLELDTLDTDGLLESAFTLPGDAPFIEGNGGSRVVAVLSTVAGRYDRSSVYYLAQGFSGRTAIDGAFGEIDFSTIPEPRGVALAVATILAVVGSRLDQSDRP